MKTPEYAKRVDALLNQATDLRIGGTSLVGFDVKDSGERAQFPSGMQRDVTTDKVLYDLVFDGPMFERLAQHLTKGAKKYEPRNWMKAKGPEEMARFRESAVRHFVQWLRGDTDEDHAAAVMFNINGYEYVKGKLAGGIIFLGEITPSIQRGSVS